VPYRLAGKRVEVQADGEMLKIYHDGELISSHARLVGSFQNRVDKAHYWGIFKPAKPNTEAAPADDVQVRDLAVYESLLEGGAL
jgi:hypothetical protein